MNAIELLIVIGGLLGFIAAIAAIQTAWNTAHSASTLKRIERHLLDQQRSN